MRGGTLAASVAMSLLIATSAVAAPSVEDPVEPMNRVGFAIYESLDKHLIRPAALAYIRVVPAPVRRSIGNVITNLHEPIVFANDLLQGRFRKARSALVRFAVNSVDGVGGLFDVAERLGVHHHDNGFALTLGRAGIRPGPFLFLPLTGPTTVRDAIGNSVDALMDPLQWFLGTRLTELVVTRVVVTRDVVTGINTRADADAALQAALADATDPYATLRSLYLQNQQAKIDDLPPGSLPSLPAFDDEQPVAPPPASQPTASLGFRAAWPQSMTWAPDEVVPADFRTSGDALRFAFVPAVAVVPLPQASGLGKSAPPGADAEVEVIGHAVAPNLRVQPRPEPTANAAPLSPMAPASEPSASPPPDAGRIDIARVDARLDWRLVGQVPVDLAMSARRAADRSTAP